MSNVSVTTLCDALERAGVTRPNTLPGKEQDIVCAVSGGLDSMVLVHLLVKAGFAVRAVHVDHAAQTQSGSWSRWVREQLEPIGVTVSVHRLIPPTTESNLEEYWRNARRDVFAREVRDGVLVTAHHKDDQAETLLLQLLRGAGPVGLQAMPLSQIQPSGAVHVRPLLEHTRADLVAYATRQNIEWIEDPSNQNQHFDRNFLRGSVLPLIQERWPGASDAIARSSELISESVALNAILAAQDTHISPDGSSLDWVPLASLGLARQANAVRFWLSRLGCRYPSRRRLAEALRQWNDAVDDRAPILELEEGAIQRYRGRLQFAFGVGTDSSGWSQELTVSDWMALPGNAGQLGLLKAADLCGRFRGAAGLVSEGSEEPLEQDPVQDDITSQDGEPDYDASPSRRGLAVSSELAARPLTVRFRQNGERLRRASGHHQTLKHWFQDNAIPPILRSRLPLVFSGGELIAIADRWVDARYRPGSDRGASQKVCYLVWRRSGA